METYTIESQNAYAGNQLADFIRSEMPNLLIPLIPEKGRYLIKASAGQGAWTKLPWIAICDKLITESPQSGYYLVFLFKEDFSGIFLSLNQGVTEVKNEYGSSAKHALIERSKDMLARIGNYPSNFISGVIDLKIRQKNTTRALYESGSILAKEYMYDCLNDNILKDLSLFLNIYKDLSERDHYCSNIQVYEEDEIGLGIEDLRKIRVHKRIDRNSRLAREAKKIHGYVCQACGMSFKERYKGLGENYIEAHHLTPLSELRGKEVKLDPQKDFTVLCPNCHRMIHKSDYCHDVEKFKKSHLKK